jgi:two-component sensor histidine kinase/DNA-binding response OmpR family regulator
MDCVVAQDKVNILLVDDLPAKLLSYEVMLAELGENLIKSSSASEALTHLLKNDIAVVLIDVCMPDLDGFELAAMIREHPRFKKTAIIFISAIQFSDVDHLRGYAIGAVDYVSVPVVPEVLRAKVKVFIELHRKTRELEELNDELEQRVAERTAALEASTAQLRQSEERRTLALSAGNMGSWDLDVRTGQHVWDDGQYRIFGVDSANFAPTQDNISALIHPEDHPKNSKTVDFGELYKREFRVVRPSGEVRWCFGTVTRTLDADGTPVRLTGVTVDITERKDAEEKRALLVREVDHRERNALAVVLSILRLTRAQTTPEFIRIVDGRIQAFAATHKLLSLTRWEGVDLREIVDAEMAAFQSRGSRRVVIEGPRVILKPATAQSVALALHEMMTNAAKYGALSKYEGHLRLTWTVDQDGLVLDWQETGGPQTAAPKSHGFGLKIVRSGIEEQLDGQVAFDWRSEGMHCRLTIPLTLIVKVPNAPIRPQTPPANHRNNGNSLSALAGKRVLVVEDEFLISRSVEDILSDLGVGVVGPVSNLSDGFSVLQRETFDGAILDINIRGQQTYPLAEILAARGVPFVFMTGYDAETVDQRYLHVPLLQKPIEFDVLKRALVTNLVKHASQ